MASTTKTDNLQLSQFVGTDKPAWLTDYNGDMQKIDAGYKELKDANADTQADLDLTKQNLTNSDSDIADLKTEVQDLQTQDNKFTNDITVLSANYETMHHEMVNNETELAAVNTDLNRNVALETQASTVHEAINEVNGGLPIRGIDSYISIKISNNGNDDNDGITKPMKTIRGILNKYGSIYYNIAINFLSEVYVIENLTIKVGHRLSFYSEDKNNPATVTLKNVKFAFTNVLTFYNGINIIFDNVTAECNELIVNGDASITLNSDSSIGRNIVLTNATLNLNGHTLSTLFGSILSTTKNTNLTGNGTLKLSSAIAMLNNVLNVNVDVKDGAICYYVSGGNIPNVVKGKAEAY